MKFICCILFLIFETINSQDIHCEGKNVEFNWCASRCPKTCQSPCRNTTACIHSCEKKCDCKSGFLLDEISLKCVEPSDCPSCNCPVNEIWTQCDAKCKKTCDSIKHRRHCVPVKSCSPGCICGRGFIRDEKTEKCIPIAMCFS